MKKFPLYSFLSCSSLSLALTTFNTCCLPWIVTSQLSGSAALAAARKSGNAPGLLPQAMALALAMGRKPMPPTRPGVSIIGPLFFHRAARDRLGRLPGNAHVLRPFPMPWRVLGHPRTTLGRHAASIMSTRRACSGRSGASRCFRKSGGVPEGLKLVPARAQ